NDRVRLWPIHFPKHWLLWKGHSASTNKGKTPAKLARHGPLAAAYGSLPPVTPDAAGFKVVNEFYTCNSDADSHMVRVPSGSTSDYVKEPVVDDTCTGHMTTSTLPSEGPVEILDTDVGHLLSDSRVIQHYRSFKWAPPDHIIELST
ncbi:Hypothetical predicted protein, partial [Pelobates cultripes]